ncbi:DUF1203 domain-containing protein [Paracoccus onubensis]|uniref:DUF1203 domain-containing protein n=1 Tax=Paracoccus onubensis TaxID=1675788 RepID=A0A418T4M5_9RHOB|nr:DUF1203 domain-containing protein [Paracoccus onubensis]RJE88181.1 DUF1203 domain-containing protein [Paracoccus onubensis]
MQIRFRPIPTALAQAWRNGAADVYGLAPEHVAASPGNGTPCRHCMEQVPEGEPYLIVAHRPFEGLNPYTESGPIFLCAAECAAGGPDFPAGFLRSKQYIVRGYSSDERIVYGTGGVVPTGEIEARCRELFTRDEIAFIHIRSASNNCFHCRVERG